MSALQAHHQALAEWWTPAQLLAPPKIILDSQSAVTDVGGFASQINDRSGNGWHFAQATAASRPQIIDGALNGRRVLRFDGSNDFLSHGGGGVDVFRTTAAGWSLTVYNKRSTAVDPEGACVFYSNATAVASKTNRFNVLAIRSSTPGLGAFASRRLTMDAPAIVGRTTSDVGNWVMRVDLADWANGDVFMHVNGALNASDTATMASGITSNVAGPGLMIGKGGTPSTGAAYADIDLAALVVGSGSIPGADDIDRLFGWAAWTFGLQVNLPGGHPYKNHAP